jgi:predicted nucleic acid-binding protein
LTASVEAFLDTNILIYAATGREDVPDKFEISRGLLTSEFGVSAQVLAEFYHNVTRKGAVPLSAEVATEWVDTLSQKPQVPVDTNVVKHGIELSKKFQTSYWDGAILAAAMKLGASILYTEDLSHGQIYETVRAINPFKPHPDFQ